MCKVTELCDQGFVMVKNCNVIILYIGFVKRLKIENNTMPIVPQLVVPHPAVQKVYIFPKNVFFL